MGLRGKRILLLEQRCRWCNVCIMPGSGGCAASQSCLCHTVILRPVSGTALRPPLLPHPLNAALPALCAFCLTRRSAGRCSAPAPHHELCPHLSTSLLFTTPPHHFCSLCPLSCWSSCHTCPLQCPRPHLPATLAPYALCSAGLLATPAPFTTHIRLLLISTVALLYSTLHYCSLCLSPEDYRSASGFLDDLLAVHPLPFTPPPYSFLPLCPAGYLSASALPG